MSNNVRIARHSYYSTPLIRLNKSNRKPPAQSPSYFTVIKPQVKRLQRIQHALVLREKKARRPLLLNSDQQIESRSKNIDYLNNELMFLQGRFRSVTSYDQQTVEAQIQQTILKKQQFLKSIAALKRKIDYNGNILTKYTQQLQKAELLNRHKDQAICDHKLSVMAQKNKNAIQKNAKTTQKIKQIESKINLYQQQYAEITKKAQEQLSLECQYNNRQKYLEKLKSKSRIQLKLLQNTYFKKITDLNYQMKGCEAINNKIIELQQRLQKNKAYIAELTTYLVSTVSQTKANSSRSSSQLTHHK